MYGDLCQTKSLSGSSKLQTIVHVQKPSLSWLNDNFGHYHKYRF